MGATSLPYPTHTLADFRAERSRFSPHASPSGASGRKHLRVFRVRFPAWTGPIRDQPLARKSPPRHPSGRRRPVISGDDPHGSGFDSRIRPSPLARPPHADVVQQPGCPAASGKTTVQVCPSAPCRFLLVSKMPGNRRVTAVQFRPANSTLRYPNSAEEHVSETCQSRFKSDSEYQPQRGQIMVGVSTPRHPLPGHTGSGRRTRVIGETGSNPHTHPKSNAGGTTMKHPRRLGALSWAGCAPHLQRDPQHRPDRARYPHPTQARNPGWAAKTASRGRL